MQWSLVSSGRLARSRPAVGGSPARKRLVGAIVSSVALAAVALPASATATGTGPAWHDGGRGGDPQDAALAFDPNAYTTLTVAVDGQPTTVRWYKEICYVANPVAAAAQQPGLGGNVTTITNTRCGYQSMNVFVPESVVGDQRTPVYFAVNNAGWASSYIRASVAEGRSYDSSTSNVGAALKAGYVFIDVANRSRNLVGADGSFPGKAPAAAVDAKAAVRYLRLNDSRMPGSAERIVVNGTSGGGALSSILGASGNSSRVLPLPRADRRGRHHLEGPQQAGRRRLRDQRLLPDHRPRERGRPVRVALQRARHPHRHQPEPLTRLGGGDRGPVPGLPGEPRGCATATGPA